MKWFFLLLPVLFLGNFINYSYAEQIFIASSEQAHKIIFDGAWTFHDEWKWASETIMDFNGEHHMAIKTTHDYENLYILIDFFSDRSIQKFADRGTVCVDNNVETTEKKPDKNTYCFLITLGSDRPVTLQGGTLLSKTGFMKKVENHPKLIAIGGVSSKDDRYSGIPHAIYEFKIPLEIFGRSNIYGFYVSAFDAKTGKEYSWPSNAGVDSYSFTQTPDKWGQIVSPDKSIPEFNFPILILLSIIIVIFLGKNDHIFVLSK